MYQRDIERWGRPIKEQLSAWGQDSPGRLRKSVSGVGQKTLYKLAPALLLIFNIFSYNLACQ